MFLYGHAPIEQYNSGWTRNRSGELFGPSSVAILSSHGREFRGRAGWYGFLQFGLVPLSLVFSHLDTESIGTHVGSTLEAALPSNVRGVRILSSSRRSGLVGFRYAHGYLHRVPSSQTTSRTRRQLVTCGGLH